jgi:hypothetical protein
MVGAASDRSPNGTAAASAPAAASPVERDLSQWKVFVREQEHLCAEHRFPAAMMSIGVDDADALEATIGPLSAVLRSTDRAGVLCPTEIAVLLVPLDSIHHAQRLVHVIDGALRAAGLDPHIGWAMRLDNHGLFHAAARADAAMLSARGHGRPSVDLSDR